MDFCEEVQEASIQNRLNKPQAMALESIKEKQVILSAGKT